MKSHWKYSNFKRGPLMSVVGIGLMAASVYVYMTKPDSEMFSLTLLGLGALAIGLKDPKIPRGGATAIIAILMMSLSSCCTFQKCSDKFGTGETYKIIVHDTVPAIVAVPTPADTLEGETSIQEVLQGKTFTDSTDKLLVKFWYDKYNNLLKYQATLKPDTVEVEVEVPVEVPADCPDTAILDKDKGASGIARLWEHVKSFSVWLLLLIIIAMIMIRKWQRLKNFGR